MGVAPSRVKEGTGEGQTTDGWQLEGTVEADQRFKLKLGTELGSTSPVWWNSADIQHSGGRLFLPWDHGILENLSILWLKGSRIMLQLNFFLLGGMSISSACIPQKGNQGKVLPVSP